eukprot:988131-Prymnesium_polylepis.1
MQQRRRSSLVEQHEAARDQQRGLHDNTTNGPERDHWPRDGEDADMLRGVVASYKEILGQVRMLLHFAVDECQAVPRTEDARAHRRLQHVGFKAPHYKRIGNLCTTR